MKQKLIPSVLVLWLAISVAGSGLLTACGTTGEGPAPERTDDRKELPAKGGEPAQPEPSSEEAPAEEAAAEDEFPKDGLFAPDEPEEEPRDPAYEAAERLIGESIGLEDYPLVEKLEQAVAACPYHYHARWRLCDVLRKQGQYDRAIEYWTTFLSADKADPHVGDFEKAIRYARGQIYEMRLLIAADLAKGSADNVDGPWSNLAAELLGKAIEQARLASKLIPENYLAYKMQGIYLFQRAEVYRRLGDSDAYRQDLIKAKKRLEEATTHALDADTFYYLGWVSESLGWANEGQSWANAILGQEGESHRSKDESQANLNYAYKQWKAYINYMPRQPTDEQQRAQLEQVKARVAAIERGLAMAKEILENEQEELTKLYRKTYELQRKLIREDKRLKREAGNIQWYEDQSDRFLTVLSFAMAARTAWKEGAHLMAKPAQLDRLSKCILAPFLGVSIGGVRIAKEYVMEMAFHPVQSTIKASEYWFDWGVRHRERLRWQIQDQSHMLDMLRMSISRRLKSREERIRALEVLLNWRSTLDPSWVTTWEEQVVAAQLFEALLTYDADNELAPACAQSWEVSDDNRAYTFHIDPDAFWSDGSPVTASDFVYGLTRHRDAEGAWAYLLDPVQEVNAIDELTLEIVTDRPYPELLPALALPIGYPLPAWAIEEHGEDWTQPGPMVGNGPFMLLAQSDENLVLYANRYYRLAEEMALDGLVFTFAEDGQVALGRYLDGEPHVLTVDDSRLLVPHGLESEALYVEPRRTYYLGLNTARWPTDLPEVRRALASALDRERLADVGDPARMPAARLLPPALPHDDGRQVGHAFDPDQARGHLHEVGLEPGSGDLDLVLLAYPLQQPLFESIVGQWEEFLEIPVEVQELEWSEYIDTLQVCAGGGPCEYNAYGLGWQMDMAEPGSMLANWQSGSLGSGYTGWQNDGYDALLEKAAQEVDPDARDTLYQQAEELLVEEETVLIPIYHGSDQVYLTREGVSGPLRSFVPPDFAFWTSPDAEE